MTVALYDIRPGNGAGQFLQPRSPHGVEHRSALVLCKQLTLLNMLTVLNIVYKTIKRKHQQQGNVTKTCHNKRKS